MDQEKKEHGELLASLVSSTPGTRSGVMIGTLTHDGIVIHVVMMRSTSDPTHGITIGKGFTRKAALTDAESFLQGALDSVDVTVIKDRP